ncbi:lysophospholipid acyltransferase family protein [Kutzneria sp. NPDC051319]|uniref:lysophospholipid acyltransferase family protein n=1 Tax=Kutzneria sp. NPDC051319 TaxID=3155047 RepID=UPI003416C81A
MSPARAAVRAVKSLGPIVRRDAAGLLRALGVRLTSTVDRLSADRGTLVVANHVSWLDIPALLAVEPLRLLAKREVGDWPLIGGMARRSGTIFIERDNIRSLPVTVARLAHALRSGCSVLVFPEGTTWCGREMGVFRRAAFQAALDADAPVRPVTISYSAPIAAYVGDDTLVASLARVARAGGLRVRVTAHPLVHGADRRELAAAARRSIDA